MTVDPATTDPIAAPGPAFRYQAFISYAREDRDAAVRLQRALESFVLPKALQLTAPGRPQGRKPFSPVFRDEDELLPGGDLPARIGEGLKGSEFLIALCSPAATQSKWVSKEIVDFTALGREKNILAIIVAGEPNAEAAGLDPMDEALPLPLRRVVRDGVVTDEPAEPLWIDWRGHARNDRLNFLRLVGALLNLSSLDDLIRRDQEAERTRRRVAQGIAAAMVALALAAAATAFVALAQRQEALASQSRFLSEKSDEARNSGDGKRALLLALEALPSGRSAILPRPVTAEALTALYDAVDRGAPLAILPPRDQMSGFSTAAFSENLTLYSLVTYHAAKTVLDGTGTRAVTVLGSRSAVLWNARTGKELAAIPGQDDNDVSSAVFSPDGTSFATTAHDGAVRLWDSQSGAARRRLPAAECKSRQLMGGKCSAFEVAFSPDGKRLAVASLDDEVHIWNPDTGASLGALKGHSWPVLSVAFDRAGDRIATLAMDGSVRVWDARSLALLMTLREASGTPSKGGSPPLIRAKLFALVFSGGGEHLIAQASDANAVNLWSLGAVNALVKLQHDKPVTDAAFNPSGELVATAAEDGGVRLWDVRSGAPAGPAMRHEAQVNSVVFTPGGGHVLTASDDGTAKLWRVKTHAATAAYRGYVCNPLPSPLISCPIKSATISADGKTIATSYADNTAATWRRVGGSVDLPKRNGELWHAVFSPNSQRVATAADDGEVVLWNAATGESLAARRIAGTAYGVAFSPDARYVLVSSFPHAYLWDTLTGTSITLPGSDGGGQMSNYVPAYDARGTYAATLSMNGKANIWQMPSGRLAATLTDSRGAIRGATFDSTGKLLLTLAGRDALQLWDVPHTTPRLVFTPPTCRNLPPRMPCTVTASAFHPHGTSIAAGLSDGSVRLLDAESGHEAKVLARAPDIIGSVAFNADGTMLAAAGGRTLRLWNPNSGRLLHELSVRAENMDFAEFSADGKLVLALAPLERTVFVWDTASGQRLVELKSDGVVRSARFSSDTNGIVTAGTSGTARLWNISWVRSVPDLIQAGCDSVPFIDGRRAALSPEERNAALLSSEGSTPCERGGLAPR